MSSDVSPFEVERDGDALLCDYLGGHPAFVGPIANGMLRRVGLGVRIRHMHVVGSEVAWRGVFEVRDATVELPVKVGRRRSMRVARAISNVSSILDGVLEFLPDRTSPRRGRRIPRSSTTFATACGSGLRPDGWLSLQGPL